MEAFLGEEAPGQGLAEGESGGRTSSSFLPPLTLLPTPHPDLTRGCTAPASSRGLPPQCLIHHGPAHGSQQPHRSTEGRQTPQTHTVQTRGFSAAPAPLCRPTGRCGLYAMGHIFLCSVVKTWQSSLVTESVGQHLMVTVYVLGSICSGS